MASKWSALFRSKYFYLNLAAILAALLLLIFLSFFALRLYTRHGEKLSIPDLKNKGIQTAVGEAEMRGFEVVVTDSLFIVGKPGGMVLNQNPVAGAFAKKGRKIYLTISKFAADKISVNTLPSLYGKNYQLKVKVLRDAFEIRSEIAGYQFDPGEPGSILAVLYGKDTIISASGIQNDVEIPKGGTLHFVLSNQEGGMVLVPDLLCQTKEEALFTVAGSKLHLEVEGEVLQGFIIEQMPAAGPSVKIERGEAIKVRLGPERPPDCPAEEEMPPADE